ncbi:hypothetical protein [Phaeobacter sp. J2-8]|uniref:hypothetical protein n=1 Tax=Phaeobacter sp. J2-8 TaxID=2931394 RepID=UPI001FD2A8B3|nr:hypothetical protein [Phaeobacter sp. J2-8]MCJ7871174.1 hypothetical protein [Phaeobacter sp. J2-8]
MRRGLGPGLAACDRIAERACSDDTAINAGQAMSGRRRPQLGKIHGLQSHPWLFGCQLGAQRRPDQGRHRAARELVRAGNAGTMQKPQGLALLLGFESNLNVLILGKGRFFTMHVLGHRLRTLLGHRHHMRKGTRHNELQRNNYDDETTDQNAFLFPPPLDTAGRHSVNNESGFQQVETHANVT